MHILYVLLVTFFAGMGAGLGTGFAGMSFLVLIKNISHNNKEVYHIDL